jgi:hypothetical protein
MYDDVDIGRQAYEENAAKADLYYAYHTIHSYIKEPFTAHQPENVWPALMLSTPPLINLFSPDPGALRYSTPLAFCHTDCNPSRSPPPAFARAMFFGPWLSRYDDVTLYDDLTLCMMM